MISKSETETAAIEADGRLEDGTIEDLKKLAADRNIDISSLVLKKDIIEKIRAESLNGKT